MKKIILALVLTLLSNQAFAKAEIKDLDSLLIPICKITEAISSRDKPSRYCLITTTTCIIDNDRRTVLMDSDCSIDQELTKGIYDSIQTQ